MSVASDIGAPTMALPPSRARPDQPVDIHARLTFQAIIAGGMLFMAYSNAAVTILPFPARGAATPIAPGFEFVDRLHDAADAVAIVVGAQPLHRPTAIAWSGC
jgi:hypothetical protein